MEYMQRVWEKLVGCGPNPSEDDIRWAMQEVSLEMVEEPCLQRNKLPEEKSGMYRAEVLSADSCQQGLRQENSGSPYNPGSHQASAEDEWPIGQEHPTQPGKPGYRLSDLEWRDHHRRELWWETLQLEREIDGKRIPSLEERYWLQLDLRLPYLGEHPPQEWTSELEGLVETELALDESYRALVWYVAELCPWLKNGSPTAGYDYDGPGLVFEALRDDPGFGSPAEWRREEIQDLRELDLPNSLGLREDLDYLILQEWELEQAYKELFNLAWRCAPEPMGTQDISTLTEVTFTQHSASSLCQLQATSAVQDLIDFSEDVAFQKHSAEEPASRQSMVNICPAPLAALEHQGGESGGLLSQRPSLPILKQAEIGDLMDFVRDAQQFETLTDAPAAGQSASDLCPQHVDTLMSKKGGPKSTHVAFPALELSMPLYGLHPPDTTDLATPMEEPTPEPTTGGLCPLPAAAPEHQKGEAQPPEHLADKPAKGQRAVNLCPAPAATPYKMDTLDTRPIKAPAEKSRQSAVGLSTSSIAETIQLLKPPAEELAPGQSADGLCPLASSPRRVKIIPEQGTDIFPTYSGPDQVEVWGLGILPPGGKNCDGTTLRLKAVGGQALVGPHLNSIPHCQEHSYAHPPCV